MSWPGKTEDLRQVEKKLPCKEKLGLEDAHLLWERLAGCTQVRAGDVGVGWGVAVGERG